jgi:hypothetical protein
MSYVQEIADKFLEKCQNATILGPDDFTLIAEWEKQEIPRDVIIAAIALLSTPDTSSIVEMRSGVKEYFIHWLQEQPPIQERRAA